MKTNISASRFFVTIVNTRASANTRKSLKSAAATAAEEIAEIAAAGLFSTECNAAAAAAAAAALADIITVRLMAATNKNYFLQLEVRDEMSNFEIFINFVKN